MSQASPNNLPVLLVVDDDELVLESLEATFEDDFVVHKAGSAERAREIVAEHTIDVVISDDRLPRESGVEFLGWLSEEQPRAIRILLTGYFSEPGDVVRAISQGRVWHYMRKPWEAGSMANIIERALESQRREAALQEAEARHRRLISSLPVGLFETDPEGNLLTWNEAFSSLLGGWPAGRVSLPERMGAESWERLQALRGSGAMERVDVQGVDGASHSLCVGLVDGDRPGVIRGTAAPATSAGSSGEDSLLRRLHHRATVSRAALLGLQETRNHLGVLGGNLELLAGELPDRDEVPEMLQAVKEAAGVISAVTSLRGRWDAGPTCDGDAVLRRIAEYRGALLPDKQMRLSLGLEGRRLAVSAEVLQELAFKLLSNAMLHGDGEGVEISSEVTDGVARIWFQDHGPGVPPDASERIFEAGFTTRPGSLGLGLGLGRQIARAAGGDLRYVPQAARGALFLLELPLSD